VAAADAHKSRPFNVVLLALPPKLPIHRMAPDSGQHAECWRLGTLVLKKRRFNPHRTAGWKFESDVRTTTRRLILNAA
jgi:hypothetical protein